MIDTSFINAFKGTGKQKKVTDLENPITDVGAISCNGDVQWAVQNELG